MVVIGLTGGIGTGKTEVSRLLQGLGAKVIEADTVGHDAYLPHTDGWREVVAAFGEQVLAPDGTVDRGRLGALVFRDPQARDRLNAILHPRMFRMMQERIQTLKSQGVQVIVVEAALLIEAGWTPLVEEVWVTVAPQEEVVRRLRGRSGLTEEEVRARIRAQLPQEERVRQAHVVIDNSGGIDHLRRQVEYLWKTRVEPKVVQNGGG